MTTTYSESLDAAVGAAQDAARASFANKPQIADLAAQAAASQAAAESASASASSAASDASAAQASAAASAALVGSPAKSAMDTAMGGDVAGLVPAVAAKVSKGAVDYNVKDYGATGNGTTDDTTAINAAVTAAPTGAQVTFPPGTYKITAPITGKAGVRYIGRGATISQATQYEPAFDLFNVNGCTVSGFTLTNVASPTSSGSAARGDAGYVFSAGVWSNGAGHTIRDLVVQNFGVGVNLNSSDGTTNVGDHAKRAGNTVDNVKVSGANHGVLMLNQDNATVTNVRTSAHVDSSAGGNPMHAVYVTGTATDRSSNVTITGCRDQDNTTGHAFQVKYTDGLTLSNGIASGCLGLLNLIDCNDVEIGKLVSAGDTSTAGSIVLQSTSTPPTRISISDVTITKAVDAPTELSIYANDSTLTNITVHALKNGLNTASSDVALRGTRLTVRGLRLHNFGSSNARGIRIGAPGYTTADLTLIDFELDGYRNLVDIDSTATGTIIKYDPAVQRRIMFGQSNYIGPVSGTPTYLVSRVAHSNVYAVTGASTQYPLGGLETVSVFNVTTSGNITVREPLIGGTTCPVGLIHEVHIWNNTAGALGTFTWNALYLWKSGSAPATPAAGASLHLRFMWDGTKWREI
jgi:polygalacturonase